MKKKRHCGYSELFHDAGLAFVDSQGEILYASHAERYSKIKNDSQLPDVMHAMIKPDDHVTFYEDHSIRKDVEESLITVRPFTDNIVGSTIAGALDYDDYIDHHTSHAAAGFYTRPWDSVEDTVTLTVDGVGEVQSMGIYDHNLNLMQAWDSPVSVGLYYTQVTKILGLRPLEDEYVTMGMSAYGEPTAADDIYNFFQDQKNDSIAINSRRAYRSFLKELFNQHGQENMAASIQRFTERVFMDLAKACRQYGSKLVVSGGCAQNIIAMTQIKESGIFDDMWIAVAPTDAGSALGAAAYTYCKTHDKTKVNWVNAFLGHDMGSNVNPKEVVNYLMDNEYCGLATGRAEFGPRALGNRSLIADPRQDVKQTVNQIKRRQEYRPFAPAILEEFADEYFTGPMNEYMQYQAIAKHDYKSVTHIDGTARVQIVRKDCQSTFRKVIEEFYDRTGVPMLLNTSLNIRHMPIVNDHRDASNFEKAYSVKVFS